MATQFLLVDKVPLLLEQTLTLTTGSTYELENLSNFPVYYYSVSSTTPNALDAAETLEYGRIIPPRNFGSDLMILPVKITVRQNTYTWVWTDQSDTAVRLAVDLEP